MMNDSSVFHLISDLTIKERVPCVLIGGFAVNHYKVTRQTADVDFLIIEEDFKKLVGSLRKAGYKSNLAQGTFAQLQSSRISLLDLDFMFVDRDTLAKILKEGEQIKIAGQKFTVPSLFHLIALKLHSIKHNPRHRLMRDLPDIISLMRVNKVDCKSKKFKELCLKYGTLGLYNQLVDALQ